jgi:hypothetical protein
MGCVRRHFRAAKRRHVRVKCDFQHPIALMAEELEGAPLGNHFHEPSHPLFAAGTKRRHDLLIPEAGVKRFTGRHHF